MQIYAHQKVKVLEETVHKTRKLRYAKKSMQASEAMWWSVDLDKGLEKLERLRLPAGGTRLNRTDYGLRPFLMVAQKRQKLLQQNCPRTPSPRPLMTAPLHAIHDITNVLVGRASFGLPYPNIAPPEVTHN